MLRNLLLSAAVLVPLTAGPAFAEPPASNWSGFYLGGNIGGAWGYAQSDYSVSFALLLDPQAGWTVGAGVAAALNRNWSVRLEYLYLDFGRFTDTAASNAGFVTATIDTRLNVNVVRVGLDYAFAPVLPPPIMTKN